MASLTDRIARMKQRVGIDRACGCNETFWVFDGGVVRSDRATPLCPHGRPWHHYSKTMVMHEPARDPNEIL